MGGTRAPAGRLVPVVGTTVAGYRIEALIGQGGMGAVYRAKDEMLGREVALKVIAPGLAQDERFRGRFLAESRTAASLDHPNVLPIYRAGSEGGLLYLAMRYVDGTDLARLLEDHEPLDPERAVALLAQIADALDAAHERGLVHRDVKPSNVLIGRAAGKEHCYLADFGLTERTHSLSDDPVTGAVVGTLDYLAPEQISGDQVGPAADVYSLGCVLQECLTGQIPFPRATDVALLWAHVHEEPERPSVVRADLPRQVDAVVARALAKEPAHRYATAGELLSAARSAIAPPVKRGGPYERPTRRLLAGAAGLGLVSLITLLLAVLLPEPDGLTSVSPNAVGVIDPESEGLVAEVAVGIDPGAIAVGEGFVWVANRADETISRVSVSSGEVVGTVPLGRYPSDLAVGHGALWVALGGRMSIARIAPGSNEAVILPLSKDEPYPDLCPWQEARVSVDSDDVWLWCSLGDGDVVVRIDPSGRTETNRAAIRYPRPTYPGAALYPEFSDFMADFGWLWLPNIAENTVWVVEPSTGEVVDRLHVGEAPSALAAGLDSLWVANSLDDTVLRVEILNPRQAITGATIQVGDAPSDIAVGEGAVWVLNSGDATVSRIDPETNEVVATIRVGNLPRGIAAAGGLVWVSVAGRPATGGR